MPLTYPGLDPEQRAQLRERLLARAGQLRDEIGAALHPGGAPTAGLAGRAGEMDDAQADVEGDLQAASLARDAAEMRDVADALDRLSAADFGACADCGTQIGWQRLQAQPQAQRCVACEATRESRRG